MRESKSLSTRSCPCSTCFILKSSKDCGSHLDHIPGGRNTSRRQGSEFQKARDLSSHIAEGPPASLTVASPHPDTRTPGEGCLPPPAPRKGLMSMSPGRVEDSWESWGGRSVSPLGRSIGFPIYCYCRSETGSLAGWPLPG